MTKTGHLTKDEQLKYKKIKESHQQQRENYKNYINSLSNAQIQELRDKADNFQLDLDLENGTVNYKKSFHPLKLNYEICYIRHGKTEGNTEPRVFQGRVDYPNNQLNEIGKEQAMQASEKMEELFYKWKPNLIVCSSLERAYQTGSYFFLKHPEIPIERHEMAEEMAFGNWDNQKVIDVEPDNIAHLFYLDQNVLVKAPKPHIVEDGWFNHAKKKGELILSENFLDVLQRFKQLLTDLQDHLIIKGRSSRVLFYGHSMAGAAVSILMGHGKQNATKDYIGFDGSYIMPNAVPTFLLPQEIT